MTEENIDYKKDLSIDPHELDEEWLSQPVLLMQYSELATQAQRDRDKAREFLDVTRAEQDKKIRGNPELYGLAKVTEAAVSFAILKTEPYKEANNELIEANYKLNLYNSAVVAFHHRKKALENLVQLMIANYFVTRSEPKAIREGKRLAEISRDDVATKQRDVLNERRRKRKN